MNYYETWDEMDPHTNALTTATDAPPGVVLVRLEDYDRLREALKEIADENRGAYTAITAKTFSVIARAALQEAEDEILLRRED